MPRSHVGIFRNERTQSTPLDSKLMFSKVSLCLGAFVIVSNCMKLGTKRCELVQLMQKFVPRSHIRILAKNTPDPPYWTLNSCFDASRCIWVHLAMFRYYTKLGAKRVEVVQLMQMFVP